MRKRNLSAWLFLGPSLLLLLLYLVYPALKTIYLSFLDARSEQFVGLDNFAFIFTSGATRVALRNNLIWLVVFTLCTVGGGLGIAVLTERVKYRSVARSVVFLPMSISYVAAAAIWKFVYAYRPVGTPQIGILNALLGLFPSFEPVGWLINKSFNNIALIAVGVWVWTGFCTVILAAGLNNLPGEVLDAARVDGANEWQTFRFVILPMMKPTIAVVATTMVIFVLKIFDIIYVMTNGTFDTEVIANRMYKEMFQFHSYGRASAMAVVLLLALIPFMISNIRRFQEQESYR
jgi:alpha-glucoside transport system permease protein